MMKLRSAMELGSAVRWRTGRWGLGRSAMGLKVGWWNRSTMRELANELERKKKNLRKKEEKREARERERKRERKKIGNVFLTREEREV